MPLEKERTASEPYSTTEIFTAMHMAKAVLQTPDSPDLKELDAARIVRQDILDISAKGNSRTSLNRIHKIVRRTLAVTQNSEKPQNAVKQAIIEELVGELSATKIVEDLLLQVGTAAQKDSESITSSLDLNIETYQQIASTFQTSFDKLPRAYGHLYTRLNQVQCHHITDRMLLDMNQRVGSTFYQALHPLNERLSDAALHHIGNKAQIAQQAIAILNTYKSVTEQTFLHIQSHIDVLLNNPIQIETLLRKIAETIYTESLLEIEGEAHEKKACQTQQEHIPTTKTKIQQLIAMQQGKKKRSLIPS